ncbi:universal stress protein [Methylomagnum sp.]
MAYRHILLAVDFSEHSERAVAKAQELARGDGAELSVIHVVEYLPTLDSSFGPIAPFDAELTEQLIDSGRKRLGELADRLGVPDHRRWIEMGSPKTEIIRIAEEQKADLIVLGSHGRHGLARLLGSTASSVIHHAGCDVLAVRLQG